MALYYFDTNPLMRWAEAQSQWADSRNRTAAQRVEELVQGQEQLAMSEVTLIEYHDRICRHKRDSKLSEYDAAWLGSVQAGVMQWVAAGRLTILEPTPRMFETAMFYISLAQTQERSLKAWDAAHLCRAMEWAREAEERVTILTGDGDLRALLDLFPKFRDYVDIEPIGIL